MVAASDGGYAHVQCSLQTPECWFDPIQGVAHGTASKLESKRNAQNMQCMFCRNRGGAIQCAANRCLNSMHASCMSAQWQARAESIRAQQQEKGSSASVEPFEGMPCVLPQIHNLSIGLFPFCPKHMSNVGVYRKQFHALRHKLAEGRHTIPAPVPSARAHDAAHDGNFHDATTALPSNPWPGLFHPDSRSHFTIRPINMPATQDKAVEALRAAQEQEAFFRDVVQPFFHEAVSAPDQHVPVQTLLQAVSTHMAPLLAAASMATGASTASDMADGKAASSAEELPADTRAALIASLALPTFAIDILMAGEEDDSCATTSEQTRQEIDGDGNLPDLVPSKRARISRGGSDEPFTTAESSLPHPAHTNEEGVAVGGARKASSELEEEAEQLHAHLTLQRHMTNIRLLQLVSRVQTEAPAALPPSMHLLDSAVAKQLAGEPPKSIATQVRTSIENELETNAAVVPADMHLLGYRGSTQPWQGPVPIQPEEPAPSLGHHPLPVPDPVWNSLSKMVTSSLRQWRAIVAHMHAGLADRSEIVSEAPASWLVHASGRQFASPGKVEGAERNVASMYTQSHLTPPSTLPAACGVCMDIRETIQDELLRCNQCKKVVVHKSCYGVPGSTKASFMCDVCRHGGGKLTPLCCMCGHIGGPVKLTRQAQWIHVFCALLSGPSWMPLPFMGPVIIDSTAAKEAQAAHMAAFAKMAEALTGPPSAMVAAVGGESIWQLFSLAQERAELYRMPAKPSPQALPNYDFGVRYAPHPRMRPPPMAQPTLLAPDSSGSSHVGTRSAPVGPRSCPICGRTEGNAGGRLQKCEGVGCALAFHPMCAWLDGLFVTACPPDRAAAVPGHTALVGGLGPALACSLYCTAHTPKRVKGRSQEVQKALRAQQCFVMRKVEAKA